jgi:hypothetical protein
LKKRCYFVTQLKLRAASISIWTSATSTNAASAQIVGGEGYAKSFIDNKLYIGHIEVAALLDVAGAEWRRVSRTTTQSACFPGTPQNNIYFWDIVAYSN